MNKKIKWLKGFHNAIVDYEKVPKSVFIFVGSMLAGLTLGAHLESDAGIINTIFCLLLAAFNIYIGLAKNKFETYD